MGLLKFRMWYQEKINLTDKLNLRNTIVYRPDSPELKIIEESTKDNSIDNEEKVNDDQTQKENDKEQSNENDNFQKSNETN